MTFYDLSQIAIRVLVLPSSEALCERVFSQLKYVHNPQRSCLKPDILNSIMNIRFGMKFNNEYFDDESDDRLDDDDTIRQLFANI